MSEQNVMMSKLKIGDLEEIEVPVHLEANNFIPPILVQHMVIQGTTDNVLVSFFESVPPIVFNPDQEEVERLKQKGYAASCVARIAIPASRFSEFAKVFAAVARLPLAEESEVSNANSE